MRDDREHLLNVLEAAELIARYVESDDVDDAVREAALTHVLSRLSRAVSQVSAEFQNLYPTVPWWEGADFTNRMAPDGMHTDGEALEDITRRRVPLLANRIRKVLLDVAPVAAAESAHVQAAEQLERLQRRRGQILELAERRGIRNIRIFGSVARGEADDRSDLDLLVDVAPGRGLFALGGFAEELAALLGTRVDVATVPELKPRIRERVLAEAVPL